MVTGYIRKGEVNPEWDSILAIRPHHNVELKLPRESLYATIENIEPVPFLSASESTWAIADGAQLDIGSISDYLEPSDGQFYALQFGMYSDVDMEVQIRNLGSTGELYGIKNESSVSLNQDSAPYKNPRIVLKALKGKAVPSFKLINSSRANATLVKFSFQGLKFTIDNVSTTKVVPATTISLTHIGESYR